MPTKINILYIDDEPENLVGFKATLRMDYQVFTASNIPDALAHLENNPDIRVVFCDQRMPGITGVEFFEQICTSYPLPVRILLTAYNDIGSMIDAINKGNIFRYVTKPWNEAEVVSAIEEANKFYLANSMLLVKNDELQKAYNELNKFAYSVSHDIRGPISGILGAIDVARGIDDLQEVKEMLYLMEKSLKKLDAYVISMHDYYNLQRGELHIDSIDFNKIIEEMKAIYNVVSMVKGVNFTAVVKQNEVFRGDEVPIKLILNNLLSNAFKYQDKNSKNKSVDVCIEVENNMVTIHVKDTGIGILGTHVGEIFNLFYRANSQESGSGFGLYNVKSALLKLNGQIEVSSVMHKGTTFKVNIPSV
ncbi:hybrid sensor histidine kinase/response regulator [Mucilaginibacter aquaedulcis]|uniref:hybrid sensor histidine kinase/response regulator n=1 Tax=Mucilaginibacter aquaedulcis TaxID=1187081 RepID=UPI0025B31762|nr:hybrid sensor histidine kinase/response regulator [Mucilaginibacter aquaedulcis]MDN3548652.1 hybrid sensor histidine kinase/response regulator [Mucilaginibacter aquaedulcis]